MIKSMKIFIIKSIISDLIIHLPKELSMPRISAIRSKVFEQTSFAQLCFEHRTANWCGGSYLRKRNK